MVLGLPHGRNLDLKIPISSIPPLACGMQVPRVTLRRLDECAAIRGALTGLTYGLDSPSLEHMAVDPPTQAKPPGKVLSPLQLPPTIASEAASKIPWSGSRLLRRDLRCGVPCTPPAPPGPNRPAGLGV